MYVGDVAPTPEMLQLFSFGTGSTIKHLMRLERRELPEGCLIVGSEEYGVTGLGSTVYIGCRYKPRTEI